MSRFSKKDLLDKISKYDFALNELNLYLDTHPHCQKGLAHFNYYKKLRAAAEREYTEQYGPLGNVVTKADSTESFSWATTPWPWERN